MEKSESAHLVMEGTDCVCRGCGQRMSIAGQYLNIAELTAKQFMKNHLHCGKKVS